MEKNLFNITDCPFCNNSEDGCCACDHTGRVRYGDNYDFKTLEDVEDIRKSFNQIISPK